MITNSNAFYIYYFLVLIKEIISGIEVWIRDLWKTNAIHEIL